MNQGLGWLIKLINSIIPYSLFLIPRLAQAQPSSPLQPGLLTDILDLGRQAAGVGLGENALYDLDLRLFVMRIIVQLLTVVGVIFLAYLIWGGVLWMTSAGAEEKIQKAQKILIRATVGVVIILLSYSATRFVAKETIRALQSSALTQVQSCAASNGTSACCPEWTAYKNGTTNLVENGGCVIGVFPFQTPKTDKACLEARYKKWTDCVDKNIKFQSK